jgi:hypothetical protein
MFKRFLWITIAIGFLLAPVLGKSLDKMSYDSAINGAELIVTGTVSEVTAIYDRAYPKGSIHKTLNNLRGKLYKIQATKILSVKPESTLSDDSPFTEFYILVKFNKNRLVLDTSSGLLKGSQYLFFLDEDKNIDAGFLEANQLPSADEAIYLSLFNDSRDSIINVKDTRYKNVMEKIQSLNGSDTGETMSNKQLEETN